jgi:WD repeat-containing protein 81
VAATALIDLCQRIGPENTFIYVLPQLKELFVELAFSHDSSGFNHPTKGIKSSDGNKSEPIKVESRIDLL